MNHHPDPSPAPSAAVRPVKRIHPNWRYLPHAAVIVGLVCLAGGFAYGFQYSPVFYTLCLPAPFLLLWGQAVFEIEDHGSLLVFRSLTQKSRIRKQDVVGFDFIPLGRRMPFFRLSIDDGRRIQVTVLTQSGKQRIGGFLSRALYGSAR